MNRVFVSSTFRDLQVYRKAVSATIRRLGAVDIAMEHLGSMEERPAAECGRLIRGQSDGFVGIYAHRYGFVPPGKKQSITVLEYKAAGKAGLDRLIYLVDENARWPRTKYEGGKPGEQLDRFKDELKLRHMCSFFTRKDQLAAMVAADLHVLFERMTRRENALRRSSPMSIDREHRLLTDVKKGAGVSAERAIAALVRSSSPEVVETLGRVVLGDEPSLARAALDTLGTEPHADPGIKSALSSGLASPHTEVRYWAAFRMGEAALQDHDWGLGFVADLTRALRLKGEDVEVMWQLVHSLAKIGGPEAFAALVALVRNADLPSHVMAAALHAPPRFWTDFRFASARSANLVDEFIRLARAEISGWPSDRCREVRSDDLFQYMSAPIRSELEDCAV